MNSYDIFIDNNKNYTIRLINHNTLMIKTMTILKTSLRWTALRNLEQYIFNLLLFSNIS